MKAPLIKITLSIMPFERTPLLNVSEGGEVNRKKYFIFKKTKETYVLFLL